MWKLANIIPIPKPNHNNNLGIYHIISRLFTLAMQPCTTQTSNLDILLYLKLTYHLQQTHWQLGDQSIQRYTHTQSSLFDQVGQTQRDFVFNIRCSVDLGTRIGWTSSGCIFAIYVINKVHFRKRHFFKHIKHISRQY